MKLPGLLLLAALPLRAEEAPLVITASRWPETPRRTGRSVSIVKPEDLLRRQPRSPAEALREEPGIMVQQTMPGHAAAAVRGLIGKDNLVLIDGVRLNNAATENIQSMSIVDPESIDSIEVLRGPGSVLYGGDALGGVVYVLPKLRRDFSKPKDLGGRLSGTYRRADDAYLGRVELSGNRGNFGFFGGASLKSFSDLDLGGSFGVARPASYRARAGDLALEARGEKTVLRVLYQHMLQADVPRYDQYRQARRYVSLGGFSEFVFDPEKRDMLVIEAQADELEGPVSGLEAKVYRHRQETGNRQRRFGAIVRQDRNDTVDTLGARLEAQAQPRTDWTILGGLEGYQDKVKSRRNDVDVLTGAVTQNDANANYPDGSKYDAVSVFLLNQWSLGEHWSADAGARLSRSRMDSTFRGAPFEGVAFKDAYTSWTGGAGLAWKAPGVKFAAGVWQGFRPPNFNDTVVLKTGPAGTDAPSPGLRPEKSLGLELSASQESGPWRQSLALFHAILKDRIDRVPGLYNGAAILNGTPVFQRANSSAGYIQGAEWEGRLDLPAGFDLRANGSWVYGRDSAAGVALSKVAPAMALAALGWRGEAVARKPWAETSVRMAGRQNRLSPGDKLDARISPDGTRAWAVWDLRAGFSPTPRTRLLAAAENLLDKAYREHASGVDAPGLNLIANLQVLF